MDTRLRPVQDAVRQRDCSRPTSSRTAATCPTDFAEGITFSGREWILESWTPEQIVYVPNPGYTGEKVPQAERIVIVPAEDGTTLLKSGAVDFIFPQAYTGIDAELDDPNVAYDSALGGSFEALYFMQVDDDRAGPFSDDDVPRGVLEVDRHRRVSTTRSTRRSPRARRC